MRQRSWLALAACGLMPLTLGGAPAYAQLNTQHIKGTVGLKAGTQPPPDVYFIAPLMAHGWSTEAWCSRWRPPPRAC